MSMIDKLKKLTAYGRVFFHSQLHRVFTPKYDESKPSKDILLIIAAGIGDAILFLDALDEMFAMFPPNSGYRFFLLSSKPVQSFYKAILSDRQIEFILPSFPDNSTNQVYKEYLDIYQCCQGKQFYLALYAMRPAIGGLCVLSVVTAKIKTGFLPDRKYGLIKTYLIKRAYTKAVPVALHGFRLNEYKAVIQSLGGDSYQTKAPYIPSLGTGSLGAHDQYILVCVGSSKAWSRWDPQKFAELINRTVDRWHIPVYLIGGAAEREIYEIIKKSLLYPNDIYDYIEKTSYAEWVELIRGGTLLIGNDSGAVHLAAAVKTPSIVIIGGWAYGILHPYRPDIVRPEDKVPICVYNRTTTHCYTCAARARSGSTPSFGNKDCQREIKRGEPVLCLQEITVDEVMEQVDKFMETEEKSKK